MDTNRRSPLHVAVVDDDADVRVAMHALLRSFGWRVTLYDGAQQLLTAGLAGIDCVLSDVQMPGMGGLELLARLRAGGSTPPCILMTAFPDEQVRRRAMAGGAVCFLSKPVDDERLAECVETATGTAL
ncbi:response regulator transcription factor [uncultured Massilia sp.]|uniref:response regulator transcription factor n=1 Tax=uncultured Massilia sp. TaxID=169973 RepID=UPI0025F51E61|nr:response regulator [uncultured Massilia sp.]